MVSSHRNAKDESGITWRTTASSYRGVDGNSKNKNNAYLKYLRH